MRTELFTRNWVLLTKWHLNFFSNALNAHEGESYDRHDWNNCPSHFVDQGQRQSKEVESDTLLQVNSIWEKSSGLREQREFERNGLQDAGMGVLATRSITPSWSTKP